MAHPLDGFGFLVPEVERRHVLGVIFSSTLFPGRAPEGHVTAHRVRRRGPESGPGPRRPADASPPGCWTTSASLLGAKGEPTFRAFQLWPKAIPQYDLTYGRFKDIMDEAERRNPGLALAGSYREGVASAR